MHNKKDMTAIAKLETRSIKIEQLDSEVLKIAKKQGIEIKIDDLEELNIAYKGLLQNRSPKLLVILDENCESELGFMKKLGEERIRRIRKAEALVVKSLGLRLEVSFYLSRYKANYPIEVFSNETEGLQWLKTID